MTDLIDDAAPDSPGGDGNLHEFGVAELSGAIKRTIEDAFGLVRVRGEIGRVTHARSGHVYLDLKDDKASISGVIWKGIAARLKTRPEEGMEVVATGRLTTFAQQGRYQLVIDNLEPAGVGALMAMLERRRQALAAEGLFDDSRKRALPYLPRVIGVVTSPQGAVIRDILHRLRDRFPTQVLIWPVVVQGERCAPEVTAAIQGFNAIAPGGPVPRPDVLIVARGGGSVEDLWGFNDEAVVRAAADSAIPLISAVGHETDTTLIDFAADHRAPTPTAAAEIAVPVRADLMAGLAALEARRLRAGSRLLEDRKRRLRDLSRALPRPEALIGERAQRLDAVAPRLVGALSRFTAEKRLRLDAGAGARLQPRLLQRALGDHRLRLSQREAALGRALSGAIERSGQRLLRGSDRLRLQPIRRAVEAGGQLLIRTSARFRRAATQQTTALRARLDALERMRLSIGYQATLKRGFAVVRGAEGVVTRAEVAGQASSLEIEFADGRVAVSGPGGEAAPTPKKPRRKPAADPGGSQGSLF